MKDRKLLWRASPFYRLFLAGDAEAKGRTCMVSSSVLATIVGSLSGGFFYSGFLLGHKIDMVDIGILTFVPYIATIFSFFSPLVLERFKKRRLVLAVTRTLYYAINILGITLVPVFVQDGWTRKVLFALIIFLASSINCLFSPGYTAWHIKFLPERVRADYFNVSGLITNFANSIILIVTSLLTDSLAGSEHQLTIITIFRFVAFGVALLDVLMLSLPKEYPYPKSREKPRLLDTITIPIKHKKFCLTILLMVVYTFAANVSTPVLNTYLVDDVGVSYTFFNGINAVFFLFYIFFGGAATRLINRFSWFKSFALVLALQAPSFLLYAFVNSENYLWLMLVVRLSQHVTGIFIGISYGNFLYINMPEKDRTSYISFYTIVVNISALLSMMFGTWFVDVMGNSALVIFGYSLTSVPLLLIMTSLFEVGVAALVMALLPKITPDPPQEEESEPVPQLEAVQGESEQG